MSQGVTSASKRRRGASLKLVCCLVAALAPNLGWSAEEFNRPAAAAAARRGLDFLLRRQAADGGWHSETYGSLRDGAAVTALSLYAISHLPPESRAPAAESCRRAYAFLEPGIEKRGYIANHDGSPDFPTYGSAMTLVAIERLKLPAQPPHVERMREYLLSEQLGKPRGFEPESPHYGGWDMLGAMGVIGRTSGTNVSITRFALEGLAGARGAKYDEARRRARAWVLRLQAAEDGGFRFEADREGLNNKAEWHDQSRELARSYGTATCDGLHILRLCGAGERDTAARRAQAWLADHPTLDDVPGFEEASATLGWREGLRFYYYQSLGALLRHLPPERAAEIREPLARRLIELQQRDGRWESESARMREDDPLIATSFALIALGELLAE